jgi:hypothetical protein
MAAERGVRGEINVDPGDVDPAALGRVLTDN